MLQMQLRQELDQLLSGRVALQVISVPEKDQLKRQLPETNSDGSTGTIDAKVKSGDQSISAMAQVKEKRRARAKLLAKAKK